MEYLIRVLGLRSGRMKFAVSTTSLLLEDDLVLALVLALRLGRTSEAHGVEVAGVAEVRPARGVI